MNWEDVIKRTDIGNVYIPSLPVMGGQDKHLSYRLEQRSKTSLGLPEPLDTLIMSMFDKLGMGHPITVNEIPATGRWVPKAPKMGGQFYIAILDKRGKVKDLGESPSGWIMHNHLRDGMTAYYLGEGEIGLTAWFDK